MSSYRVAVVALHPIQYQAGLWRTMAEHPRLDIEVLYLDKMGVDGTIEPTTGNRLAWDLPLLEGYPYRFVPNWSPARFTAIVDRINPELVAALLRGRFDAAMFHGWLPLSNWLGLATALAGKMRLVYRGEGSVIGKAPSSGTAMERLKLTLNRAFLRQMDAVAFSCADNRRYQLSRGARRSSLFAMPCAVDNAMLQAVAKGAAPDRLRQSLGIAHDATVILAAGRFTERKRMADIVSALPADAHLLLAGSGPLQQALEDLVKQSGVEDRVHFLGFLNQPQLLEAMLASDIFAMASSYDPSPKAMSEALAFGLPLVCSDGVGTCEDLVKDNGFDYPCGDVQALAACLSRLHEDVPLRQRMAQRAKELAAENDFAASVESLLNKLDQLQGESA